MGLLSEEELRGGWNGREGKTGMFFTKQKILCNLLE